MYSKDNTLKLLKKLITQKLIEKQERYPTKENRYTELLKNPERTPVDNDEWFIYVPSYSWLFPFSPEEKLKSPTAGRAYPTSFRLKSTLASPTRAKA